MQHAPLPMSIATGAVLAALLLSGAAPAPAADPAGGAKKNVAGLAKRAYDVAQKKDPVATVRALEEALDAAQAEAPLEIRALAVVKEPPTGLGLYVPAK